MCHLSYSDMNSHLPLKKKNNFENIPKQLYFCCCCNINYVEFSFFFSFKHILFTTVYEWDWATCYAYTSSLVSTCTRHTFSNKCLNYVENEYHLVFVCSVYRYAKCQSLPNYYWSWPNVSKLSPLLHANSKMLYNKKCVLF